jgi:hypothetical protein
MNEVSQAVKERFRENISGYHLYIIFEMTLEVIRSGLWFILPSEKEYIQSDALAGPPG